jgi:excisionase family DNA binding protein
VYAALRDRLIEQLRIQTTHTDRRRTVWLEAGRGIVRGLGQYQTGQMKDVDRRIGQLFHRLREVVDILEHMMLRPHSSPRQDQSVQPKPEKSSPAPSVQEPKLAYTVKEVCKMVGIGRGMFYQAIRDKKLRAVKCGHRTLVMAKDLEAWMQSWPER